MPLSKTRGSTGKKCPFSPRPQRGRKGSEPQLLSRERPLTPAHGPAPSQKSSFGSIIVPCDFHLHLQVREESLPGL